MAPDQSEHPQRIGRYRVIRRLGSGGMGEVFLAEDDLLHRRVALKRASRKVAEDSPRRQMILREAKRAAAVADRRIAAVYDVVEEGDDVVLVMEFVEGRTLRAEAHGPMPLEQFWDVATQATEALAVAHQSGLIHRDIKPENLMITPKGQVKILDFGIAREAAAEHDTLTSEGGMAGTPRYMSPETLLGKPADGRSDIFSLGVTFYELLAGGPPFEGPSPAAVADRILHYSPPPLHKRNPNISPKLGQLIERMMDRDPDRRPQQAEEVLRGLLQARGGPQPAAVWSGETIAMAPEGRQSARWAWMAVAVVSVAAAAWGLLQLTHRGALSLPAQKYVALMPPTKPDADQAFADLFLGVDETLALLLNRRTDPPAFQMVDFAEVYEQTPHTPSDMHTLFGANLVLKPSFTRSPDRFQAELELYDAVSGRRLAVRSVERPLQDLFGFVNEVHRVAAELAGLPPVEKVAEDRFGIRGAGTFQFYLQGMGALRSASSKEDVERGRSDFELARRTDTKAGLVRAGLARAELGLYIRTREASWLQKADQTAKEAVNLDPKRQETHRVLGYVLSSAKDWTRAADAFAQACPLDYTDHRAWLQWGRVYNRLNNPEEERRIYERLLERRPEAWRPHWWLATWWYRQGNVEQAETHYKAMIASVPEYYKGYTSLAGMEILVGRYAEAVDHLQTSIQICPTKAAFSNLGTAHFNLRQFNEAVEAYQQAIQLGFADYEIWINLGDAYTFTPQPDSRAADAYEQAVRLGQEEIEQRATTAHSKDVMIDANLAVVLPRVGRPDRARVHLDRALAEAPSNPMVQYCAALTLWECNDTETALDWLEKSVRGGYPRIWLRDSPQFDAWREQPRFQALVREEGRSETTNTGDQK